jgi:hypothetical protein
MVHVILLQNVCGQQGGHYIVERLWTTWSVLYYSRTYVVIMVRIILLLNVSGQHGPYHIFVERM